MAESIVQVTEGSGKKLHTNSYTVGANTVEDEYVLHGEPFLAEYRGVTGTTFASAATADSHIVQIMAGASLNVYVRRIRIYQHQVATAAQFSTFQLVRLSTAGTGGSAFTPSPIDTRDAACGATMMTLPTVKGTESGPIIDQADAYFMQTLTATVPPQSALILDFDFRAIRGKAARIPAGTANGLAVKIRTATAGATLSPVIEFVEANY